MASGVRRMEEGDIEAAAAMQVEAFGGNLPEVIERYHSGPRSTWRDGWVVEEDAEVRAAALAIPARWRFGARGYDVSAVAAVAVRPTDRRRGYASALMRGLLHAEKAQGRPYSALYPFQHGFYRRLGYGSAGLMHFWRLPTAQLPDEPSLRARVRVVREEDRPSVADAYARWLPSNSGFERNPRQWDRRWTNSDDKWVVYEDQPNGIGGYLCYRANGSSLDIRELITLNGDAERGLWSFMAAQVEQRSAVTYHAPLDQPLWSILREPHMFEAANRGFIITDVAAVTISYMARVVDATQALAQRAYAPRLRANLTLRLIDPVLAPEGETLRVEIIDGWASVSAASEPVDAECDIVTLSQLMFGALKASQARRYGHLQTSEETARQLDQAFDLVPPLIHPSDWF